MHNSVVSYLTSRKFKFLENESGGKHCSLKSGGVASVYAQPRSAEEYIFIIKYLSKQGIPYRVVGGLSNTLLATDVYDGVIVSTRELNALDFDGKTVSALCGSSLASIMSSAFKRSLGGAESLWLIPGTLGGAICGNAGAHGVQTSDLVESVTVFSCDGRMWSLNSAEMHFSYRDSLLKNDRQLHVLSAKLNLSPKAQEDILSQRKGFLEMRHSTQPTGLPSLGCVFKRHKGIGAGYYIDRAGLKGVRVGDAVVSDKHAGFILNIGSAGWRDIIELASHVENVVFDKFGIRLEREIEIIS